MKIIRILIILAAFLIMISSMVSLIAPKDPKTAVYINIAAMATLVVVITLLNFQKQNNAKRHR